MCIYIHVYIYAWSSHESVVVKLELGAIVNSGSGPTTRKGYCFSRHGVLALKEVPGGLADNVGPPKHTREFGLREALRPE